jgi:hypothetical protein
MISKIYSEVANSFSKAFPAASIEKIVPESLSGIDPQKIKIYLTLAGWEKTETSSDGTIDIVTRWEARTLMHLKETENEENLEKRSQILAEAISVFVHQNRFECERCYDCEFIEAIDDSFYWDKGLYKSWLITFEMMANIGTRNEDDMTIYGIVEPQKHPVNDVIEIDYA